MTAGADIEQARQAWGRIRGSGKRNWDDWVTISKALAVGRQQAMETAGCDRPYGKKYTASVGEWLRAAELESIPVQVRSRCHQIAENLPAIEAWRSGLEPGLRDTFNHPDSVWWNYKKSQRAKPGPANRAAEHPRQAPSDLFTTILQAIEGSWRSDDQLVIARSVYLAVNQMISPTRKAA